MRDFAITIGTYPGILFGIRSYNVHGESNRIDHVLYLPLIDICLTIYRNNKDKD